MKHEENKNLMDRVESGEWQISCLVINILPQHEYEYSPARGVSLKVLTLLNYSHFSSSDAQHIVTLKITDW